MVHMEQWKPIEGYEGLYEISSLGRIKSLSKRGSSKERILRFSKFEYLTTGLSKDNKQTMFRVHRLVAKHFIPNKKGYRFVNHLNGDKHDNRVENLEWCDPSMNLLHSFAIGLRTNVGEDNPKSKFTAREVKFLRWIKHKFPELTAKDVSEFYKVTDAAVCDIWNFKRWKHL